MLEFDWSRLVVFAQEGPVLLGPGGAEAAEAVNGAAEAAAATVDPLANLAYLVAAVLFIFGIKGLTHPRTAVRGNLLGALGMLVAVVATIWQLEIMPIGVAMAGMAIGAVLGAVLALKVQMTQMPQFVALFNGFGGLASLLVAGAEVIKGPRATAAELTSLVVQGDPQRVEDVIRALANQPDPRVAIFAAALAGLIGAVTFTGSMIAAGKLEELSMFRKPWSFPGQQAVNALFLILCLVLAGVMLQGYAWPYFLLVLVAGVLGVLLVLPIGGADMPVVIALLNSYSGLAAAAAGFVISNTVLIISGSLVGASGIILTAIMCKAMNRSLANVLFGTMGPAAGGPAADDVYEGRIKSTSADEVAMLLDGVQRVVIVPGYGLAVAQAQHIVRELANLLEERGVTVEYAIHPVAGRMPGHMNVLLAEADVPYDQLKEMDEINPTLAQADVVIVIGANDVVNPVAKTDPNSPIAGMPIINAGDARTVVVVKRSLSPGFAGIPNPLFAADNCLMLFGDGKKALVDVVAALKEAA
jgi:H+-translocating NAD(P) transhydrogenase subunit beta